ncbi:MAG: AI-2E family transporter [Myxococcales bacterium]|nr:AI-2E family transporter [Myxococcales bacterium]
MEDRVRTACLVIIATILVGAALYWLRPVMVPFVMALFITLGLHASAEFLHVQLRVPRSLAMGVTVFLGLGSLVAVAMLVSVSVGQLAAKSDLYTEQLGELIAQLLEWVPSQWRQEQEQALAQIPVSTVGGFLVRTANAVAGALSNSFVVLIFVLFLMLGGKRRAASGMWGEAEQRIKRYIATKAVISLATGFLVGLTLTLLGVPLAMVFGLFAFLLNFVPSIGSIAATLLPLPVLVVSPEVSSGAAAAAIAIPGVIQLSIGNFVEPKIMGESMDLHPVVILLSLILWGMLWGILGMILSVPIMVVVKILCERFEGSRPVADLLAGRIDAMVNPGTI